MNEGRTSYTVGQVAELAGVTVRALRYYDEIGLLPPSGRTGAGYRRYTPADLDRLARVLYYRELGFSLGQIATILDDPSADTAAHLRRQHALLHGGRYGDTATTHGQPGRSGQRSSQPVAVVSRRES